MEQGQQPFTTRHMYSILTRILKPGGIFVSSTVCLGHSYLRFIKLVAPLGKMLGLMPDAFVLTEAELPSEVTRAGFEIKRQWHHGKNVLAVFMIVQKVQPDPGAEKSPN